MVVPAPGPTLPELDAPGDGPFCANAAPDNAAMQTDAMKNFFKMCLLELSLVVTGNLRQTRIVPNKVKARNLAADDFIPGKFHECRAGSSRCLNSMIS